MATKTLALSLVLLLSVSQSTQAEDAPTTIRVMTFNIRVGSAGGTEITQGFLSAAASIRYNSTIFGFHTPSSGPASYVLTAINATNADVVAVLNPTSGGVRLAAVEQPMA